MMILAVPMFHQIAVLAGLFELVRFLARTLGDDHVLRDLHPALHGLVPAAAPCADLVEIERHRRRRHPWGSLSWYLLPLLWPALVTTGLLAFIGAWNEFLFALTFHLLRNHPDGASGVRLSPAQASRKSPGVRSWRPRSS